MQGGGSLNDDDDAASIGGPSSSSSAIGGPSSSVEQFGGSNFNPNQFVEKIASIVTDKVTKQFRAAQPFWRNYEISEPTIASEVITNRAIVPEAFSSNIKKNDLADDFDSEHLLRLIPKRFKLQAQTLLKAFDERAAEFTFNTNGIVFIDGTSLPGTNIFHLLPALFKHSKSRTKIIGFSDVLQKLVDMGLAHLIIGAHAAPKVKREKQTLVTPNMTPSSSKTNWWYLN